MQKTIIDNIGFPVKNVTVKSVEFGNKLHLLCTNKYIIDIVNRPDVLEVVTRKASAKLGRPITVVLVDKENASANGEQLNSLLQFGREHSGVINIKE